MTTHPTKSSICESWVADLVEIFRAGRGQDCGIPESSYRPFSVMYIENALKLHGDYFSYGSYEEYTKLFHNS